MIKVKKISKIIASAVMSLALIGSAMPMTTSAVTYDNCDVNRDGVVNARDASALSRYLDGKEYVYNYNNYDSNKSLIIDKSDLEFVLSKLLGRTHASYYLSRTTNSGVSYPNISGFTPDYAASLTSLREYVKYSFREEEQENVESDYELIPPTLNANYNERGIIGSDTRIISENAENNGIVNVGENGTGFIVGDHQIATAAHVLYRHDTENPDLSDWYFDRETPLFLYNYNDDGTISYTNALRAVEMHIPKKFMENDNVAAYDYALITVAEDLSDRVQFSIGTSYNLNPTAFSNIPINVTGYSQYRPITNANNSSFDLYTGEGRVITGNTNIDIPYWLYHDVDTINGQSGSPIYAITRNVINGVRTHTYTALAVNTGSDGKLNASYNYGVLFTKYHLQFYKDNNNIVFVW